MDTRTILHDKFDVLKGHFSSSAILPCRKQGNKC